MADQQKPKSPSGSFTWLWMLAALITVGGFLTWLGIASEPTSVSVVEDTTEEDILEPGVTRVVKDTLAADKARFEGRQIQVANVAATGVLGDRIFWGELGDPSNQVPILIRLDSAAAAGFQPEVGTAYTVTGIPLPMTDSLAGAWLEAGDLAGEGERLQAAFADYYIQTRRVRVTPRSQQPGAGSGGGSGGSGDGGGGGEASPEAGSAG